MEELLSVIDFARTVGVSPSTLRYYDDTGVFNPKIRGNNNNYRYYSMQQLTLYNFVRVLTELKVPLKTIIDIRQNHSPEVMLELFANHEKLIYKEILRLRELSSVLKVVSDLIREGLAADENLITVERKKPLRLIHGPPNNYNGPNFYSAYADFCINSKKLGINLSYPVGGYFDSYKRFASAPSRPVNFISIDPNGSGERPEGLYIVAYTRGYYGVTGDSAQRVQAFADANNFELCGPVYNIYFLDELSVSNTDSYLMQITASAREK